MAASGFRDGKTPSPALSIKCRACFSSLLTAIVKRRRSPLVLVPVELKRSGTRDAFKVNFTGDELIQNLSLQAKLKTDFGIDLPLYDQESKSDADDLASLQEYFSQVSTSVEKYNRWKVSSDEIQLGFFSFGKFLMFKDLDPTVWPVDKQPDSHPVIERLLGENGFAGESSVVPDGAHLDEVIQPGDVHFVRDADSTQTLAILEARGGRNLVIQGPPGTGKSQTITNIVAELIGNGKTVLFVAEKMAALDVVKRRLDENHLGDAVLELHSHKATKQSVLRELARTLDQGKPILPDPADDIAGLQAARNELNDYCNAVNAPVEPSNVPFITALGTFTVLLLDDQPALQPSMSACPAAGQCSSLQSSWMRRTARSFPHWCGHCVPASADQSCRHTTTEMSWPCAASCRWFAFDRLQHCPQCPPDSVDT